MADSDSGLGLWWILVIMIIMTVICVGALIFTKQYEKHAGIQHEEGTGVEKWGLGHIVGKSSAWP